MRTDQERIAGPLFVTAMVAVTLIGPLSVHAFIPALPIVQRAFAMDDAMAQSMLSITLLGMAASTLFYGSLSDRYGRRPVLLIGIAVRMAILARRREISIMKTIAATDAYICRPFLVSGLFTGLPRAILALLLT